MIVYISGSVYVIFYMKSRFYRVLVADDRQDISDRFF